MREKQGNIARVGLPKLLYSIFVKADRYAILDIIREPVKKRFYFIDGIPVAATSNILNEVLGRLLIQEGIITQKQYERSLEVVLKEKKRHGEVLISMRLLTKDQLDSFLALQLKRRLLRIFSWNDGTYRYMKADSVPAGLSRFPLHPAALILEGISVGFYPELNLRSDLKPWTDRVLAPSLSSERKGCTLDDFGLNLQEKRFFESFDGQKTLKEILDSSDLLRQRALSLALSFIITGALRAQGAAPETIELEETTETRAIEAGGEARLSAELMFIKAKASLAEGSYKDAIDTLRQITDLNPTEGEYWAYLGWAVYKDDPSKLKEAEQLIKDSIDINNELDNAWYFLGRIFLEAGDMEWAQKALRTSLAKNPWMTEALYELKRLELKGKTATATPRSPEYKEGLASLGFKDDPFEKTPDSRFMTLPASRADLLEKVLKDIRTQTEPVLITGPDGSGKTTFALEIIRSLSTDKALVCYIGEPPEKELLLVREINAEFGVQTESATTKELLLSLGMRVTQNRIQGGRALIIIDNAERLSPGCLKLIQYLSRIRSIQLVLVAAPDLVVRLKDPDLAELDAKILVRHSLEPIDLQESRAYIERRVHEALGSAPPKGFFLLTDEAVEGIYEASNGLPGLINDSVVKLITSKADETKRPGIPEQPAATFETTEGPSVEPSVSFEAGAGALTTAEEEAPAPIKKTEGPSSAEAAQFEPFISFEAEPPVSEEAAPAEQPFQEPAREPSPEPSKEAAPLYKESAAAAKSPDISRREKAASTPAPGLQKREVQPVPAKKGLKRVFLWVAVMLVIGLIIGALIGVFIFGYTWPPASQTPSTVVAPIDASAPGQGLQAPPPSMDATAPAEGSAPL